MSIGGNLASIHSAAESLFLSDLVKRAAGYHRRTWVGAFDAVKVSYTQINTSLYPGQQYSRVP